MNIPGRLRISIENQLLLFCARSELTPQNAASILHILDQGVDWESLVKGAIRQGIPTLVFYHLNNLGYLEDIPSQYRSVLANTYFSARLFAMRQRHEFARLIKALNTDIMPLKGLLLRELVYPEPGLRPSGDIDLLVRSPAIKHAEAVLQSLGYNPDESQHPKNWYQPQNCHHLVPYRLPDRDVLVEIHWDLAPPRTQLDMNIEAIWRRAAPGNLAGCPVYLITPEDLLLHICLHAFSWVQTVPSRTLPRLHRLIDIAEVLRKYKTQLDWDFIHDTAQKWEIRPVLYWILMVTQRLIETGGLDQQLANLKPDQFDDKLISRTSRFILGLSTLEPRDASRYRFIYYFWVQSLLGKLRLLFESVFPSPNDMRQIYHLRPGLSWIFLYYLMRPFQLTYRFARVMTQNKL